MIPRKPPIAEPKHDPDAARLVVRVEPCVLDGLPSAASTASRTFRSSRRASFGETTSGGSKSLTSAATRTGKLARVERRMKSMPLSPASAALHVEGVSSPSGLTAPIPVITTRRTEPA